MPKNKLIPRIIIPFDDIRRQEAEEATNDAFKEIAKERVSSRKVLKAINIFLNAFSKARQKVIKK